MALHYYRWHLFKLLNNEQGLDKLRRTYGAWLEHTRIAAARWLTVFSTKESNQYSVSFEADGIQL